jgi:hypothetical protein
MMKLILRMFKGPIKKFFLKELEDKQEEWLDLLNEKIDIPKIDEAEEYDLLNQLYDVLQESVETIIDRI